METFVTKPEIVEAAKFLGPYSYDEMCWEWEDFKYASSLKNGILKIGAAYAGIGDYIVKKENGSFTIMKPEAFELMYRLQEKTSIG